ncbi:efflux RND transporter permease subunit [Flocculibacter collagenilyticus]|uniref:efflux RND transporter permease subunit n=1 Tax=Flocculibacter collagenilyticus TaxID=2744479 RepID=UPI001F2280FB|nr:efflux RND transporter permease subunit [Flocculibacter collagenilyticus]
MNKTNATALSASSGVAKFITQHAIIIIALFVIVTSVLGWFIQQFKLDASADTLLIKNNPLYVQTQVMNQRFSPQEFILVAFEPKSGNVFSESTFEHIQQMSQAFSQLERVESVTNILNVPLLLNMQTLDPNLKAEEWTWQSKRYSPEVMKNTFDKHPLYTDLLVNEQQTATAIQIVFKADSALTELNNKITNIQKTVLTDELTAQQQADIDQLKRQAQPLEDKLQQQRWQEIDQIETIVKQHHDTGNVYLGGAHVLGYQLIKIIQSDLVIFGSAIGGVICLILFALFRRWRWVFIPIVCCGVSVAMTMGMFGMLGMRTTVISSNFIALQLILTLAIVIHLLVEFRQLAQQHPNAEQGELVAQTFNNKIKPCFYAGLTTSVGFGSLIFSNIQPVVTFGWMMIVAMVISISVSLLLFPALLSMFKRKEVTAPNSAFNAMLSGMANIANNHKGVIVALSVVVVVVSALGTLKLSVENSFLNYFKDTTQVRQELDFIDKQFGGSTPLDIVYTIPNPAEEKNLVVTAETIQTLQKIQHVLKQYDATGNVTSVVNFTELAKKINDGKPLTEYELTAVYHLLDDSLKDKLLGAYFIAEQDQLRISARVKDSTENLNRTEFLATLKQDIEGLGITKDSYSVTNLFVLYQDILQRLFNSQILTLGLVYIVLGIVLLLIFKSIKVALIALIPNIICTLVILGVMGWFNIALDLMTITIAAIAMGIAVDDTIHFVHRYLEENKHQNQSNESVNNTFNSVGYALLYTTLIITCGFGLLALSDFVPSILFGMLTGLAMLVALITDLTLLPALLGKFVKPKTT